MEEILEKYNIITNPKFSNLKDIAKPTSVILFCEEILNGNKNLELADINNVQNMFVFALSHDKIKNNKIHIIKNHKKIKNLADNILIILDLNDNFKYLKFAIKALDETIRVCKEKNINIVIIKNNSKYYDEVLNCIKACFIYEKSERCEFVYDTVCEMLDKEFRGKNHCEFDCNGSCIGNKNGAIPHDKMGCCYAFDYAGIFSLTALKNIRLCHFLTDSGCSTKNISCKLFTCSELKKKNVIFNQHEILLLECFFNKKQHLVLHSSYFVSREDIIEKLLEEDNSSYFNYYLFDKYDIKKHYY